MGIADYLRSDLVLFLDVKSRNDAIMALIQRLNEKGVLENKEAFTHAIFEREKVVSTGIGLGVAIPHAKLSSFDEFFIAIGIMKNLGLDWNAIDGGPVKIIFMIGGPENRQTEYLQILSRLTMAIKDEKRRKKMLKANDSSEIITLFEEC